MENNNNQQPISRSQRHAGQSPKSHRTRNIILGVVAALAVALLAFGTNFYMSTKEAAKKTYQSANIKKSRDVSELLSQGKPFTVLLLGTDTGAIGREFANPRTDTMMLVTINPEKKKTTIVSIPRDQATAVVGAEEYFPSKLNAAYVYGGAGATIKTVQEWLNVPIDYYGVVNMGAMEKIIDQLGGVTVKSPLTFEYNPDDEVVGQVAYYSFTEGSDEYTFYPDGPGTAGQTSKVMDGKAALAFSRMRKVDPMGDYGRQQRQQLVVQAVVDKAKAHPTKLVNKKFLNLLSDNIQTDLTFDDLLTIVGKYAGAANKVVRDHAQGTSVGFAGQSFEYVDNDERQRITDLLRKSLGLKAEKTGNPFGSTNVSAADLAAYGFDAEGNILTGGN